MNMAKEYYVTDAWGNIWASGLKTMHEANEALCEVYRWFKEVGEDEPPELEIDFKIISLK